MMQYVRGLSGVRSYILRERTWKAVGTVPPEGLYLSAKIVQTIWERHMMDPHLINKRQLGPVLSSSMLGHTLVCGQVIGRRIVF